MRSSSAFADWRFVFPLTEVDRKQEGGENKGGKHVFIHLHRECLTDSWIIVYRFL